MRSDAVVIVPSLSLRSWPCFGRAKHLSLMGWWMPALAPNTPFQNKVKQLSLLLVDLPRAKHQTGTAVLAYTRAAYHWRENLKLKQISCQHGVGSSHAHMLALKVK